MGLYYEGARLNPRAYFVPHERTVHETQGGMCLGVRRKVWIKVGGIRAPDAQDTTALGLSRFCSPESRWGMQQPRRQRRTSGDTGFQQITSAEPLGLLGTCWRCMHREPSLESVP